uniref:Uncharacterized protein n=1 Tax=Setaria viridis TaxID=4556 RepID=A0A4U6V7J0_SETVI|nr:hypothetical protein SEVIR_3G096966v2 [Setaria viridis]
MSSIRFLWLMLCTPSILNYMSFSISKFIDFCYASIHILCLDA